MDTSREDVGISIRSAFLRKGTQQRFSLFVLIIISILLIFLETIDAKPLNRIRSFVKDVIYRSAAVATYPTKIFSGSYSSIQGHFGLYRNYNDLKKEKYFSSLFHLHQSSFLLQNSGEMKSPFFLVMELHLMI